MRQEKGKKGEALSMGFGFVECSSEAVAKAVLKRLQVWHLTAYQSVSKFEKSVGQVLQPATLTRLG